MFNNKKSLVVGIAGPSGSGKTYLSKKITEALSNRKKVFHIELDNFYNDFSYLIPEKRSLINFDHPDAIDWNLLREIAKKIKMNDMLEIPQYDFKTHTRKKEVVYINNYKLLIIEGIFSFYNDEFNSIYDIKIYLDTPIDLCLLRRIKRDVKERGRTYIFVLNQYEKTVMPMYYKYVQSQKKVADIIIGNQNGYGNILNFLKTILYKEQE